MIIQPDRPLWQRAINRMTHASGIKLFPVAFESDLPQAGRDPKTVFDAVYAANYWESDESKSGSGSEVAVTRPYVIALTEAIGQLGIKSMFDAPCGDLNWIEPVIDLTGISYIGGDVATEAVEIANSRRPDLDIRQFDICADDYPDADLWHCRDTMFHLSFSDIWRAIAKAKQSNIEYAALTTHKAVYLCNLDIKTGGWRLLDLERAPFNFPAPLRYLRDFEAGDFPRYVGIWRIADLPV